MAFLGLSPWMGVAMLTSAAWEDERCICSHSVTAHDTDSRAGVSGPSSLLAIVHFPMQMCQARLTGSRLLSVWVSESAPIFDHKQEKFF